MERFIALDAHASSCTLGVVTAVRESRGPKDDRRDAFGLADALRLGAIERQIASIMLAVWRTGEAYDPLRGTQRLAVMRSPSALLGPKASPAPASRATASR